MYALSCSINFDFRLARARRNNRDLRDRFRRLQSAAGQTIKALDAQPQAIFAVTLTAFGLLGLALEGRPDTAMLFGLGTAPVLIRWGR